MLLNQGCKVYLEGIKTLVPFITAFISYWIIGIPAGYYLAANTNLGPFGLWVGITLGLTCAAIGFFVRLQIVQRRAELQVNSSNGPKKS